MIIKRQRVGFFYVSLVIFLILCLFLVFCSVSGGGGRCVYLFVCWGFFKCLLSVLSNYFCPRNPVNAAWEGLVAGLPRRRLIGIGETQQSTQSLEWEVAFQPDIPFLSLHLNFWILLAWWDASVVPSVCSLHQKRARSCEKLAHLICEEDNWETLLARIQVVSSTHQDVGANFSVLTHQEIPDCPKES